MKNTLWILVVFGLLMGPAVNSPAETRDGEKGAGPAGEQKSSSESGKFDAATTQYLKKQRSINSDLVAAHRELYNYNNPDRSARGISMGNILDQENASREARQQEQATRGKKADAERRIDSLRKDLENLKADLLKHYNGTLPRPVSDAWQTEEGYATYLISKYR